jgi:antitoxin HicB
MRYTVILEQERDGGYVATVPALPGCVTQGDTRDEVLKTIREAADLYIEDCIAAGDPVPTEAGRDVPFTNQHRQECLRYQIS